MASMQVPFSKQNYTRSKAVFCRRTTGVILSGIFITKILSIFRYIWIWLTFFTIIASIIFFYAFIYNTKFHIYPFENSIFLSIDIYFNGNSPTLVGRYSYVYFYMENIVSFLINTLYLANIVRLIFEPKLVKKQN